MYESKVWIFDNIVDLETQNNIKDTLCGQKSDNFSWFFISDITGNMSTQLRPAFQHTLIRDCENNSKYNDMILPVVKNSAKKIKFKYDNIIHGRCFLQLPLNVNKETVDTPHVDLNYKHLVVLYYVANSDGDTILYNEQTKLNATKYTIKKKIKPKQGRVVIFDGRFYHTAEQPTKDIRCVVNYNLI